MRNFKKAALHQTFVMLYIQPGELFIREDVKELQQHNIRLTNRRLLRRFIPVLI